MKTCASTMKKIITLKFHFNPTTKGGIMPKTYETNETSINDRKLTPFEEAEQRRQERKILRAIIEETETIVSGLDLFDDMDPIGLDRSLIEEIIDQKIIKMAEIMRDRFGVEA